MIWMHDDTEPEPGESQDGQASSSTNPPKIDIDRTKGFDLDNVLKFEIPMNRDLEEVLRRVDEDTEK
jgi:hypothetical protein